MTKKTITKVEDLQDGDIATFRYAGRDYTGPVFVDKDNDLRFMDWVLLWGDHKGPSSLADFFVSATREVPALPTEPLSVITDVIVESGNTYPLAMRTDVELRPFRWRAFSASGRQTNWLNDHDIVSFKLAKVVEA